VEIGWAMELVYEDEEKDESEDEKSGKVRMGGEKETEELGQIDARR
jgi:hypothetical protein